MEELSGILEETFSLKEGNNTSESHPRFSKYKNEGRAKEIQRQRREEYKKRQLERRFNYLQILRGLKTEIGGVIKDDFDVDSMDDTDSVTSSDTTKERIQVKRKKKEEKKNYLMFSEWMVDIPENFETEWLMKLCPKGRRQLVVAANGLTNIYAKSGFRVNQFLSHLPGGCKSNRDSLTILDCILDTEKNIFYVLDLISWDNTDFSSSEFEFRHYWLISRFEENSLFGERTKKNPYSFIPLPIYPCTKEGITEGINKEISFKLDGLLFYSKSVFYESGQNPFVGWLLPWMLPDCLGIDIPEKYKENGENKEVKEFISNFNQTHDFTGSVKKTKTCSEKMI
ncbi:Snurportin-1 [Strongyloides ratti]|uniref:Snurportin-1 n=1 Tax=Strongyloides ratti TaxID=34506 RepID=A0A090N047_STRRB|nr:Snurportin-1 [Strongyloides ratti]CEF70055.1 Snurportin-1 [Strongyloides ratti]